MGRHQCQGFGSSIQLRCLADRTAASAASAHQVYMGLLSYEVLFTIGIQVATFYYIIPWSIAYYEATGKEQHRLPDGSASSTCSLHLLDSTLFLRFFSLAVGLLAVHTHDNGSSTSLYLGLHLALKSPKRLVSWLAPSPFYPIFSYQEEKDYYNNQNNK